MAKTAQKYPVWLILLLLFIITGVTGALFDFGNDFARGGELARMATAESLVERGTFSIDESPGLATVDKVYIEGRFYGCQTPVMPMMMSVSYFPLYKIGLSFARYRDFVVWFLTWLFTGAAIAGAAALLGKAHFIEYERSREAIACALLFFFGTLYIAYSSVLSNHIFSGFLVFAAFFVVIYKHGQKAWLLIAGFAVSIAAMTDPPAGFAFGAGLLIYQIAVNRSVSGALLFLLGAAPPAAAHVIANVSFSGSIIPVNLRPELFAYSGAIFDKSNLSGVVANTKISDIIWYGFHSLIGHRGWFSYTPLLLFGLWGLIAALRQREYRNRALLLIIPLFAVTAFYIWRTKNFGDCAYGNRFFLAITPAMFYGIVFLGGRLKQKVVSPLFKVAVVWSIIVALVGMIRPISDAKLGLNTFATNLYYLQTITFPRLSPLSTNCIAYLSGCDPDVIQRQGRWLFDLGQYSTALKILDKTPSDVDNRIAEKTRGEISMSRGDYAAAIARFEAVWEKFADPDFLYLIGRSYTWMGERDSGNLYLNRYLALLDSEIEKAPPQLAQQGLIYFDSPYDRDRALAILADNLIVMGDIDSAAAVLHRGFTFGDSLLEVKVAKARFYAMKNDEEAVSMYLTKAVEQHPRLYSELQGDSLLRKYLEKMNWEKQGR